MISAQCIVIPNEVRDLTIEAWIALDNGRVLMSLWEVLRIRSG
jgi:hypothetical protein